MEIVIGLPLSKEPEIPAFHSNSDEIILAMILSLKSASENCLDFGGVIVCGSALLSSSSLKRF